MMNNTISLVDSQPNNITILYNCSSTEKIDIYEGITLQRKIEVITHGNEIEIKVHYPNDGYGYPTKKGPKVKITTANTTLPIELVL